MARSLSLEGFWEEGDTGVVLRVKDGVDGADAPIVWRRKSDDRAFDVQAWRLALDREAEAMCVAAVGRARGVPSPVPAWTRHVVN